MTSREAQVASLTRRHGTPVAVNYQSGGGVAYATWLSNGRLLGYSLGFEEATLEYDLQLTLIECCAGGPNWAPEHYAPDTTGSIHAYWDSEDDEIYADGTYTVHRMEANASARYGVGEVQA